MFFLFREKSGKIRKNREKCAKRSNLILVFMRIFLNFLENFKDFQKNFFMFHSIKLFKNLEKIGKNVKNGQT